MGMTSGRRVGLADALFGPVQRRVLGLLFGQPNRRFQSAELIRLAGLGGRGAVQRQLQRLETVGLVEVTRVGNQKFYQARADSPVFQELTALVTKTVGIVDPIRAALRPRARGIRAAFVYGSAAAGTDRASSDIDVMILSDALGYPEAFEMLEPVERRLGRPVSPTVMTPSEWTRKRGQKGSFADRVVKSPKLFIIGDESTLA